MDTPKAMDRTRHHDLTVEEVKACPSFADFTNEQAKEVIEILKLFTKIAYDFYEKLPKSGGNRM